MRRGGGTIEYLYCYCTLWFGCSDSLNPHMLLVVGSVGWLLFSFWLTIDLLLELLWDRAACSECTWLSHYPAGFSWLYESKEQHGDVNKGHFTLTKNCWNDGGAIFKMARLSTRLMCSLPRAESAGSHLNSKGRGEGKKKTR